MNRDHQETGSSTHTRRLRSDCDREASQVAAVEERDPPHCGRRNAGRANRSRQERHAERSLSPVSYDTRDEQDSNTDETYPSSALTRQYRRRSPALGTIHRRSLARSPRDRIATARHDRELRHFRQSHFLRERRSLKRHYEIVTKLKDAGPVTALGGMEFRVKGRSVRTMAVIKNALAFTVIGDTTVFYRLKT